MRSVVLVVIMVSAWLLPGIAPAEAQTNGSGGGFEGQPLPDDIDLADLPPGVYYIDGQEIIVGDPFGSVPPGFDDPFGPPPDEFLANVPPEYAFFYDLSLPVPEEFAFLDDPRLPVPPEYEFLFNPMLPVPEEFWWMLGPAAGAPTGQPAPAPQPTAAPEPTAAPAPTPTAAPAPTPAAVPATTLDTALDEADPANSADQSDATGDTSAAATEAVAAEPADEAPPAEASPSTPAVLPAVVPDVPLSNQPIAASSPVSLLPLLIFVAVVTVALFAAVPFFLNRRAGSDSALRELALTDDLTKLANRRRLDRDLHHHQRTGTSIAIAMIDIDHFKRLNDDFGHATGDVVLQQVASTISRTVRAGDVVYRYGGEEFCVLLPDVTEFEAAGVIDRVRSAVEALSLECVDRVVTVSAGVAQTASSTAAGNDAVRLADAALYSAKHAGRNRVMLASMLGVPAPAR